MNAEEQNSKNRGSILLLLGMIILVGIVIVVYGIIVTAETNSKTAHTLPYIDDELPVKLETMKRLKEELADKDEEIENLRKTISLYEEIIETLYVDMVEFNQTIASRF